MRSNLPQSAVFLAMLDCCPSTAYAWLPAAAPPLIFGKAPRQQRKNAVRLLLSTISQRTADAGTNKDEPIISRIWREIPLEESHQEQDLRIEETSHDDIHAKFLECESVIEISSLLDATDCEQLAQAAHQTARRYRQQLPCQSQEEEEEIDVSIPTSHHNNNNNKNQRGGLVRLPTAKAAHRADASKTPYADCLDPSADALVDRILMRVFDFVDQEFPSLVQSLFFQTTNHGSSTTVTSSSSTPPPNNNATTNITTTTTTLAQLYQEQQDLAFASREPAVNVYTEGGRFHAHTDGQSLTILIPLLLSATSNSSLSSQISSSSSSSSSGEKNNQFEGGGTAFWSESKRHRIDPPSLILRPPKQGTVLLFGGHVMHAGLPVESGERVVLVASMSRRRPQ